MVFSSIEFLFLFLPLCLGVYYLLPFRFGLKNYWLLLTSLLFYAWGEPSFVFVMLGSIAFNYAVALCIDRSAGGWRKSFMWLSVAGNLSILGLWKYANFITHTLREWLPLCQGVIPQTSFVLPIGISFFTFQAMSYVLDVYNRKATVQRNPFYLALYIALFPQLIAGPIVRYATVCDQILSRRTTRDMFASGVLRFLIGFNKKVLLANTLAVTVDKVFDCPTPDMPSAWLGMICYVFQLYFDFGGYSDMAVGLGRMFGFTLPENFNYPYISRSMTEFWRRWHMSLGAWFRDYLYFPLGGSRVGDLRLLINLCLLWFLTGLWHGASWNYILWGSIIGVIVIVEKFTGFARRTASDVRLGVLGWFAVMSVHTLTLVFVRSPDLAFAGVMFKALFGNGGPAPIVGFARFHFHESARFLLVAAVASLPLVPFLAKKTAGPIRWAAAYRGGFFLLQVALFVVGVSYLSADSYNPFIYFNF